MLRAIAVIFIVALLVSACSAGDLSSTNPQQVGDPNRWKDTPWEGQNFIGEWQITQVNERGEALIKTAGADQYFREIWVRKNADGTLSYIKTYPDAGKRSALLKELEIYIFQNDRLKLPFPKESYFIDELGRLNMPDLGNGVDDFLGKDASQLPVRIKQMMYGVAQTYEEMYPEYIMNDTGYTQYAYNKAIGRFVIIDAEHGYWHAPINPDIETYRWTYRSDLERRLLDAWWEYEGKDRFSAKPAFTWDDYDNFIATGGIIDPPVAGDPPDAPKPIAPTVAAVLDDTAKQKIAGVVPAEKVSAFRQLNKTLDQWNIWDPGTAKWYTVEVPAGTSVTAESLTVAMEAAGIPKPPLSVGEKLLEKLGPTLRVGGKIILVVGVVATGFIILDDAGRDLLGWYDTFPLGAPVINHIPSTDDSLVQELINVGLERTFVFQEFSGPTLSEHWEMVKSRTLEGKSPCFWREFDDPEVVGIWGLTTMAERDWNTQLLFCPAQNAVQTNNPGIWIIHANGQQQIWQLQGSTWVMTSGNQVISYPIPNVANRIPAGITCEMRSYIDANFVEKHTAECWR